MLSLKKTKKIAAFPSLFLLLGFVACSSDSDNGEECGGHGELHGDHCDCDQGYEPDHDDELMCVEAHGDEECGGHGELHDDHCHCDDGYVVDEDDETRCVEEDDEDPDGMGGNGRRQQPT